jgi:hypothetical protein
MDRFLETIKLKVNKIFGNSSGQRFDVAYQYVDLNVDSQNAEHRGNLVYVLSPYGFIVLRKIWQPWTRGLLYCWTVFQKNQFQLLGAAAIFLASKMLEPSPIPAVALVRSTADTYDREELLVKACF